MLHFFFICLAYPRYKYLLIIKKIIATIIKVSKTNKSNNVDIYNISNILRDFSKNIR